MEGVYTEYLKRTHKKFKELNDLSTAALNENIYLCGRVVCNSEGIVNPKSADLELISGKDDVMRIPLDFNEDENLTKDFVLFQG